MARTVFVPGGDRGLGFALCAGLLEQGWQVFAGQYMPEWPDLSTLAGQYPQALHILPLGVSSVESAHAAAEAESNWLPAPDGPFSLQARLYWPRPEALDPLYAPPPVKKA